MTILTIAVILLACFADPVAQVLLKGRYNGTVGWWEYHIWHWLSFYPPLVLIVLRQWWPRIQKMFPPADWVESEDMPECPCVYERFEWRYVWYILAVTIAAWLVWQLGLQYAGAPWESWIVTMVKGWFR